MCAGVCGLIFWGGGGERVGSDKIKNYDSSWIVRSPLKASNRPVEGSWARRQYDRMSNFLCRRNAQIMGGGRGGREAREVRDERGGGRLLSPGHRLWIRKGFSMYFWITQTRLLPQKSERHQLGKCEGSVARASWKTPQQLPYFDSDDHHMSAGESSKKNPERLHKKNFLKGRSCYQ